MSKIAVIGAGIFGIVTALELAKKHEVILIEQNVEIMSVSSYINQARVHRGYHYPRSEETALQCLQNYEEFEREFAYAIIKDFKQHYCIAKKGSKISPQDYLNFLDKMGLPYKIVNLDDNILVNDSIAITVEVEEYAFDSKLIKLNLQKSIEKNENIKLLLQSKVINGSFSNNLFEITYNTSGENFTIEVDYVINSTYTNINGILGLFGLPLLPLEHQLTEMSIINAKKYRDLGITIMDGNFMSIMPFDSIGRSSISNVRLTPHEISKNSYPTFSCNVIENSYCSPLNMETCKNCRFRPQSNFTKMIEFAKGFLSYAEELEFMESLITTKTIINDPLDGRPSKIYSESNDRIFSILAGKVDTVFEISRMISKTINKKENLN